MDGIAYSSYESRVTSQSRELRFLLPSCLLYSVFTSLRRKDSLRSMSFILSHYLILLPILQTYKLIVKKKTTSKNVEYKTFIHRINTDLICIELQPGKPAKNPHEHGRFISSVPIASIFITHLDCCMFVTLSRLEC